MAIHYKDRKRAADPNKPFAGAYRLLGVNEANQPYFFWSETPAEYAAYLGPSAPFGVWGAINKDDCKNNMQNHHKAFIADYETALKLEALGVVRPCGKCNRLEKKRYDLAGNLRVNPKIEIE